METLTPHDLLPPADDELAFVPDEGSPARSQARALGQAAIEAGEVGVLVLNGGLATRFNGTVKGVSVDVLGRSFIHWKLAQARALSPGLPVFFMNSPFTHEPTLAHLAGMGGLARATHCFVQGVLPRLLPDGGVLAGDDGAPSVTGTGHGDLFASFARSGMLDLFARAGRSTLFVSNVDNLGAMLDPLLVGLHRLSGRPATVEVVRRDPAHTGGIVARVRGRVELVESFRLPAGLDLGPYRYFNTNSFCFDRGLLESLPDLPLHSVVKEERGRRVVHREKILGEVTAAAPTCFLVVPDGGEGNRFIPAKTPEELERSAGAIDLVLRRWGLYR